MEKEPRYTQEQQEEMYCYFNKTVEGIYERTEQQEMIIFVRDLVERIEGDRDAFFWGADNASERRDNERVRQREERGDREFDYKRAISGLLVKLASIDSEKRRKIMKKIIRGVDYTICGIYVARPEDIPGHHTAPLFSDIANNPLKYLIKNERRTKN